MQLILIALVLALTGADHWTTYQCLRAPVEGWNVTEANPLAGWLFELAGLVPGLLIDSLLTVGAVVVLVSTQRLSENTKLGFLAIVAALTAYAVINNLGAMADLGLLSPATLGPLALLPAVAMPTHWLLKANALSVADAAAQAGAGGGARG